MKKNFIEKLLPIFASLSCLFLFGIILTLFIEGLPIFKTVGFFEFIFSKSWHPTYEPPEFGILPLILSSLWVTVFALVIAIPLSLGSAIYISELASPRMKEILKPIIELLAGIPSVVYGFFGMVFLAPLVQKIFNLPTGLTCFTASVILGIMVVPTITSLAEDAISAISKDTREASFALGATKWETITRAVVPAASSGIVTAIILGMGRAAGETMTVLMVAGGATMIPKSLFQPVRPMTATIAAEMGEAPMGSAHYHALFAIALVLFFLTLILNLLVDWLSSRRKR
ncbi:phosphate ABC transporter permease subunit PstC [Candidatus Aerophobetes bacterium]|nr:phosphate ABC transporter permease subunit PstC [Candidatus Aerophobetes bacterium]